MIAKVRIKKRKVNRLITVNVSPFFLREALATRLEKEAESGEPLPSELDLGNVKVLINPLMIRLSGEESPREPTLRECESVIKQMFRNHLRQEQEVSGRTFSHFQF